MFKRKLTALLLIVATLFLPPAAAMEKLISGNTYSLVIPADGTTGAPMASVSQNQDLAALITHTAAVAGVSGTDQINVNSRGAQVGVNITAATGTAPTLQVIVEGKDPSGTYYTVFASAALVAAPGFTLLSVYPGLTSSAVVGTQVLPRTWRVRTVIGGTTPAVTATVSASVIV